MKEVTNIKSEVNQSAIEVLEHALEKAKSGEYAGVHVCWVLGNGTVGGEYSTGENISMWASIELGARKYFDLVFMMDAE